MDNEQIEREVKFMQEKEIVTLDVKFRGLDDWNRPIYKVIDKQIYLGSVNTLFPDKVKAPNNTTKEINDYFRNNIKEIEFFGGSFNCEPHGGLPSNYVVNIID